MATAKLTPQSAADRKAAEAELKELVAKFTPKQAPLVGTVRRAIRKRLPTAHEMVYEYRDCFVSSFSPSERGFEGVLVVRGSARGVDLYVAKGLPDPDKLLQGSAGKVRFVTIESAAMLKRPAIVRLMNAAIANNTVPFARTGRGTITVRLTTARKKR